MLSENNWNSKLGFILAAAGSAIGLGAVWRFPYMTAEHGGGAFLFVFLLFTILIGLPLLISEFVIGRASGRNPIDGFEYLSGKKSLRIFGWIGHFGTMLLLSFYSVIGGWILIYLLIALMDFLNLYTVNDYTVLLGDVITNPVYVIAAQGIFIFITAFVVAQGIQKGLERASKIMMPMLFILFLFIIIRSLSLPNAFEGVKYFLLPDFSELSANGIMFALGQSFFALSVGITQMITYASYLKADQNLPKSASYIVLMNIAVSVMVGLAIFPAIASFGMQSMEGPGLVFIVLPEIFNAIPFGIIFYLMFLFAFLFATLTSSFSMIEINVANTVKGDQSKRKKVTYIYAVIVFAIGIPSALSEGVLNDVQFFAGTIFDNVDFLVSNILLPAGALFSSIFIGYILDRRVAMEQLNVTKGSSSYTVFKAWIFLLRFILPAIILFVFIMNIISVF
ncbi:sodium-dependent transporter [Jeotgalicoccus nanhaiensis]|uniref:Transporter n=1 Tax=Jeotgalicoccus nanhaiensis TaxID=568603 RepID=A0ABR9XY39_9STAP|nr:sodium-dependent transporter [Jeotgalicoccus nanhaiensis]MBF0753914.1 sodium-dependent transporter [Jeotgalicoccus nanhaiensis]TFU62069.1 sodium-dependent transporter [Jeotgalicoccus nanhaiensis]